MFHGVIQKITLAQFFETGCIFDSDVPGAMTSSSHMFIRSAIGNWTMTYRKGGRLYGQYTETVAAAGTAPGY